MKSTIEQLPDHLKKYVVDQNYGRYTSEDQAVWRYILKQLKSYLKVHAHETYVDGLEKTGITLENIPRIEDVDRKLKEFGWAAVPISGFIPPAAFMEFQSLGILPIASDIRTIDHIHYTPAPDIVHESAGHAPILIDPKFSEYLRSYATVAKKAIFSREDLLLYEAIRELSDIKENPKSTPEEIKKHESNLQQVVASMRYISEAAILARMNWWTAEYGLIGPVDDPKIFGAGLLSSVGEARSCLQPSVEKIPLSVKCVDYAYDITEKQPQLFVAENFQRLITVLEELSETMAYKKGGIYGLEKALESKTVNTVQLDSGLQISGELESYKAQNNEATFIKFLGPVQLCLEGAELPGHGTNYHEGGYSTPLGAIKGSTAKPGKMKLHDLEALGIAKGKSVELTFESGVHVDGTVDDILTQKNGQVLLISFSHCRVYDDENTYFKPEWGIFDMALGMSIPSVFGGPADRQAYGETVDFVAKIIPDRKLTAEEKNLHQFYLDIRNLREGSLSESGRISQLQQLVDDYRENFTHHWLVGVELLELAFAFSADKEIVSEILNILEQQKAANPENKVLIEDGIKLAQD